MLISEAMSTATAVVAASAALFGALVTNIPVPMNLEVSASALAGACRRGGCLTTLELSYQNVHTQ